MRIYEVWDDDPMENHCPGYIESRFLNRDKADARAEQLNLSHRMRFFRDADDGPRRADKEPWCWRTARVKGVEVTE